MRFMLAVICMAAIAVPAHSMGISITGNVEAGYRDSEDESFQQAAFATANTGNAFNVGSAAAASNNTAGGRDVNYSGDADPEGSFSSWGKLYIEGDVAEGKPAVVMGGAHNAVEINFVELCFHVGCGISDCCYTIMLSAIYCFHHPLRSRHRVHRVIYFYYFSLRGGNTPQTPLKGGFKQQALPRLGGIYAPLRRANDLLSRSD